MRLVKLSIRARRPNYLEQREARLGGGSRTNTRKILHQEIRTYGESCEHSWLELSIDSSLRTGGFSHNIA
jgi:hypothetical protein